MAGDIYSALEGEKAREVFGRLCVPYKEGRERCERLLRGFESAFGRPAEALFSAPGRTEIGGNHTDHENGCVLAGSVNLDVLAAAAPNGKSEINFISEGFGTISVNLSELEPKARELNTSEALVRGVAARFKQLGLECAGFDAYSVSNVLSGSGLSSSAAFEVMLGTILNGLFNDGKIDPVLIAQIGQYAENNYFGKPCGLLDQMACSVGGAVFMDFRDTKNPLFEPLDFDFSLFGHELCIIDSGADHADLTDEYSAITGELDAVCAYFGKEVLREVSREDFERELPALRKLAGDRAVLRAYHIYEENERALAQKQALPAGDFEGFLRLVSESGRSSFMYLQNVVPTGSVKAQEVAFALSLCERLLKGRGAFRVHGGGFAGTVQAFVPHDMAEDFKAEIERVLGAGSCYVLQIRPLGGARLF
ncbi:MAG: galactokinase family protein [Oscillospiraceae bacterium]|nr:galactokinase family protein [Oscillospiraceae bacterium]